MSDSEAYTWHLIPEAEFIAVAFLEEKQTRTVKVNGQKYCIARYQGEYYALYDRCPHAGGSLGKGWCDDAGRAVCPLHRIKFDLATGENTSGEGYNMETFPVKQQEDSLYLGLPNRKKWYHFW